MLWVIKKSIKLAIWKILIYTHVLNQGGKGVRSPPDLIRENNLIRLGCYRMQHNL